MKQNIMAELKGPYTLEERLNVWAVIDSFGDDIAYVDKRPSIIDGQPCGSVTSRGYTAEQLEMRARLFAAAPQMLAAIHGALRIAPLWAANPEASTPQNAEELQALALMLEQFKQVARYATGREPQS